MGEISSSSSDEFTEDLEYLTSFYRIIMPSALREYRLVLPKEFVGEYGKELSRTIRLETCVGGGDIWHIKLKKLGSLLCLQDGWEDFVKHYSIGFGYFLIFKYKGNSQFHLRIFDLTATEIDYSKSSGQQLPTHHAKTVKIEKDDPFPDVFVSNHQPQEEGALSSKRNTFTEFPPREMQNQQSDSSKRYKLPMTDEKLRNCSKSHTVKEKRIGKQPGCSSIEVDEAVHEFVASGTKEPTWKHEAERKRAHSCTLRMSDSNVSRYAMNLPTHFCKDNMRDFAEVVQLQDSDDSTRRWPVQCRKYDFRWNLGKGWSDFVKAKMLKEGDECVFEIMAKGIIKVSVSKGDWCWEPVTLQHENKRKSV